MPSKAIKTRYAIHFSSNREGDFEFLTHNQSNWSSNLKKVKEELEGLIDDYMHDYDPPLSRKDALWELGQPVIFKLTVEEVK